MALSLKCSIVVRENGEDQSYITVEEAMVSHIDVVARRLEDVQRTTRG